MEFMILLVMMCIILYSTIKSLVIFNFPYVFKISFFLLEHMNKFHNQSMLTCIQQTRVIS